MPLSKSSMITIGASSARARAIAARFAIPDERVSGMSLTFPPSPTSLRLSKVTS